MKFHLLTVGTSPREYKLLIDDYKKRITRFSHFDEINIQYKAKKNDTSNVIIKQEGKKILEKIPQKERIFLLDDKGKEYSSKGLASFLKNQMLLSQDCWFVIGGAYGFSDEVYASAYEKISLSKMTFNHHMAKLFFTEQFYRAMSILNNHPYHNA